MGVMLNQRPNPLACLPLQPQTCVAVVNLSSGIFMKPSSEPDSLIGRPNRVMARVVHEVLFLFHQGQRDQALALAQHHHVPLDVLERVVLRRGRRRKRIG
jgi:hypothetical protein